MKRQSDFPADAEKADSRMTTPGSSDRSSAHWDGCLPVESMLGVLVDQLFFPDIPEGAENPLAHGKNCLQLGIVNPEQKAADYAEFWGMPELAAALTPDLPLEEWPVLVHAACQGRPQRIVFKSSGSTGQPTRSVQNYADMVAESHNLTANLDKTVRVIGVVPRHHIYGFYYLVMLPLALWVPVLSFPPLYTTLLSSCLRRGDLLVAFPLFWKSVAGLGHRLPDGLDGSSSTGPCPALLILELMKLGLGQMLETYGSSETGGIGRRYHPEQPYVLFQHWELETSPGSNASAEDAVAAGRRIKRRLPDGKFGPVMDMPDLVEWCGERSFVPIRRTDQAVQVGGENVYPQRVADCIKAHPRVADCVVRLMRPEEGQRLKAFVVLKNDSLDNHSPIRQEMARQLAKHCRATLRAAECPRSFRFGPSVPKSSIGKDADWDISE